MISTATALEELFQQNRGHEPEASVPSSCPEWSGTSSFIAVDEIERKTYGWCLQGVEGAYSQAAMKAYFGEEISTFQGTVAGCHGSHAEGSAEILYSFY